MKDCFGDFPKREVQRFWRQSKETVPEISDDGLCMTLF